MKNGPEAYKNSLETVKQSLLKATKVDDFFELEYIRIVGDSEKVEMGDSLLLEKNDCISTYSFGANPCVSGIIQTHNNELYMIHSNGCEFSDEQDAIIANCKSGIIGGGLETLDKFSDNLRKLNIKIIPSPGRDYAFDIAYIKEKNEFGVKPGMYYCYDLN